MENKENKRGRPKGENTKLINFRAPSITIDSAKNKHGKGLNKVFNKWLKKIAG